MAAKVVHLPSRSSKATSELMCVTPAGKIGNCTCGMPNCCHIRPKKAAFFPPSARAKTVSSHFLSLPMFHTKGSGVLKIRNLVDQACVSAALHRIDTGTGMFGETGNVHFINHCA